MKTYFDFQVQELKEWIEQTKGTCFLFLEGPLGVGKTQLTKELLAAFGYSPDEVQSPTFLKMLEYEVPRLGKVLHLDCYRMEEPLELEALSLEHYMESARLIIVEWPELFKNYIVQSGLERVWLQTSSQKTLILDPF